MSNICRILTTACGLALLLAGSGSAADTDLVESELDIFWAEVSRTVSEGDFEGYAATYHPDAILVSHATHTSYPIAKALSGWEQGFRDTEAGTMQARVEFRFTQRLHDGTTAHETGIFHYSATPEQGEVVDQYLHFEALLVSKDGWKMMMEFQKTPATVEEWVAAE